MKVVPGQGDWPAAGRRDICSRGFTHWPTGTQAGQFKTGVRSQLANMGGYALANWPTTSRQKVRRRASGGKFARQGFTAGCRDRPCVSDHHVWGGVGRRPGIRFNDRLRNKMAEEKRILCHTTQVARGGGKRLAGGECG